MVVNEIVLIMPIILIAYHLGNMKDQIYKSNSRLWAEIEFPLVTASS